MVSVWESVVTSSPWVWIFVGIGVYWLAVVWLRRAGLLPEYIGNQGPILTLHTRRFRDLLDRLARPKRAWRAWGNFGVGVALVVMVGSFVFLAIIAYDQLQSPQQPTAVNQPQNVLVIPGVNEFLPLSVAPEIVIGLLVGLVVHEGGHGLLCRVGDIEIESLGLALLAVLPVGAFVEPDEDSRRAADRGDQTRMFAAGVMNNFAVTIVAFALLFGPVVGAMVVAPGAAVGGAFPGSAAAEAGIDRGDRIVGVEGQAVATNEDLGDVLASLPDREVTVEVDDGDRVRTTTVRRSLLVTGLTGGTALADGLDVNATVTAVNGTAVHTESDLADALEDHQVATIEATRDTGERVSVTGPAGAAVVVDGDGPAAAAGLPVDERAVVTAIDDERVVSANALAAVMDDTEPGQTVTIEYYIDGERSTHDVALGEHQDGHGLVGVDVIGGVSGVVVSDFGTRLYPADLYRQAIGGVGGAPFWRQVLLALQLPLAGLIGLPYNFAGFTGGIANFYEIRGPLSALGGTAFGLANVLFWTGWINLNLGIFNCIPAFPLDGGHILRTSTEAIVSRLPVRERRRLTTMVTTSVGLTMLASLILMLFGPQLLR